MFDPSTANERLGVGNTYASGDPTSASLRDYINLKLAARGFQIVGNEKDYPFLQAKEGQSDVGSMDLIILGLGFVLWVAGLIAASISYQLTPYPLILHLSLPLVALLLFRISYVFR